MITGYQKIIGIFFTITKNNFVGKTSSVHDSRKFCQIYFEHFTNSQNEKIIFHLFQLVVFEKLANSHKLKKCAKFLKVEISSKNLFLKFKFLMKILRKYCVLNLRRKF